MVKTNNTTQTQLTHKKNLSVSVLTFLLHWNIRRNYVIDTIMILWELLNINYRKYFFAQI